MRDIDWEAIRLEYVTKKTTYSSLAEKYKISKSQIGDRAIKEKWREQRKAHTDRVRKKAERKIGNKQARELAKVWEMQSKLDAAFMRFVSQLAEGDLHAMTDGRQPGREFQAASAFALNSLEVKRAEFNMLSPKDQAKLDLEREKLQLERDRFEAEKVKTEKEVENGTSIHVIFDDPEGDGNG